VNTLDSSQVLSSVQQDRASESATVVRRSKLRFAIMCSGEDLPSAFARSVEELLAVEGVELALVIVDSNSPRRPTFWNEVKRAVSSKKYLWAALGFFSPRENLPSFRTVNMSKVFAGIPKMRCEVVRKGKFSQYFRSEDVELVRSYNLDFILRFAFGIIRGEILQAARYGVWSFHHGDETKFRGGPPAFWEIYKGDPVTGAILQRLTDRLDGGVVLQRCFIRTNKLSHRANLNAIMWAATHMPARVCRDIFNGRAQYLDSPPSRTDVPVLRSPNDLEMVLFLFKIIASWFTGRFRSVLFAPDWNVGVVRQPIHSFLNPDFQPQVEWLKLGRPGHYIADPFVIKIKSQFRLLVENFDFASNRGAIFEAQLPGWGNSGPAFKSSINHSLHMSYPYLFEHNGKYYCAPEAYQTKSVPLYVLDVERDSWSQVATLIEGFAAVDPTLFQYDGRWWLFCTNHGSDVEQKLFLWHAPDLLGPWEPHCANPVKVDVRSSRPAGRPFLFEGRLYRPAQDSSKGYGCAITINRVNRLTILEFAEEPVAHIRPIQSSPYRRGIHTLVGCENITVLDGNRLLFAPGLIWHRVKYKFREAWRPKRPSELHSPKNAVPAFTSIDLTPASSRIADRER
jgi:hypothetical protein